MTDIGISQRPADRVTASLLTRQLAAVLPPAVAKAIGENLAWLADNGHLVGRERFLTLAQESRELVRDLPERPDVAQGVAA